MYLRRNTTGFAQICSVVKNSATKPKTKPQKNPPANLWWLHLLVHLHHSPTKTYRYVDWLYFKARDVLQVLLTPYLSQGLDNCTTLPYPQDRQIKPSILLHILCTLAWGISGDQASIELLLATDCCIFSSIFFFWFWNRKIYKDLDLHKWVMILTNKLQICKTQSHAEKHLKFHIPCTSLDEHLTWVLHWRDVWKQLLKAQLCQALKIM